MKPDGVFRRPLAWMKEKAPGVYRFLTRHDKPFPLIREIGAIALFIILGMSLLWGLTGQELGKSPVVVIESGSMMHCDQGPKTPSRVCEGPFGRIGTIDPGDLVFVQDVDSRSDVEAWGESAKDSCRHDPSTPYLECGCDGVKRFGACGDVVIFRPDGDRSRTPVIHRALFWLEIHGGDQFTVEACDLHRVPRAALNNVCMSRLGANVLGGNEALDNMGPQHSGFITRGDNNGDIDQGGHQAISRLPVAVSHSVGKARGEVPWVGLVKLFVTDLFTPSNNYQNAPSDTKLMMWLTVALIFGTPFAVETIGKIRRNMRDEEPPEEAPGPPPGRRDGGGGQDGPPQRRSMRERKP